jgi:hypothetical protein
MTLRTVLLTICPAAVLLLLTGCPPGGGNNGGNNGGNRDGQRGGGATDGGAAVEQTGGRTVDTPQDLVHRERPDILSPPILVEPLLGCGLAVTVQGFIPGAMIDIVQDGTRIGGGVGTQPWGQTFTVSPALVVTKQVIATQTFTGHTSGPSKPVTVQDHRDVYPSGLPRPRFPALPLYECGIATVVDTLPPGATVRVRDHDPATPPATPLTVIGQVAGTAAGQPLGIGPAFLLHHEVTAQAEICSDSSPVSFPQTVQPPPPVLPKPELRDLYDNGTWAVLGQLVNGSRVTITHGGTPIGGGGAPADLVRFPVSPVLHDGDTIEATQELCGRHSDPGTGTVHPCSDLPPAHMQAPQPGDTQIRFVDALPGSRILIFASGEEIADGGGPVIQLTRPLNDGETVTAVQIMGSCIAHSSHQLDVGRGLDDPGSQGACRVEEWEYGRPGTPDARTTDITAYFNSPDTDVSIPMSAVPLHALVRVPSGTGPFPLVLVVHGNHGATEASEPGYVYLLDHLASHCIIAASVDENFLNGNVGGEMDARAIVLLRHLQLWREWDRTPGNRFYGRVDLGAIGIAGHSRGGEMVTVAPLYDSLLHNPADPAHDFDFRIRGAYAIAPVDGQIDDRRISPVIVQGTDYYVMHGTHDGDVSDFSGYRTYDRAFPVDGAASHFKGLLWVYGANHGQWNTVWGTGSESAVNPVAHRISGDDQRAIGKTYMNAFFLSSLRGQSSYNAFFSGEASFGSLPRAVRRVFQYQDPKRVFLNHYEEDADPSIGSFPGVTSSPVGPLTVYRQAAFSNQGPPFWTWEETQGLVTGWQNSSGEVVVRVPPGLAAQAAQYPFLALRVAQTYEQPAGKNTPGMNKDFSVQLRFASGDAPEVAVSSLAALPYPEETDHPVHGNQTKTVLQTVRFPWRRFLGDRPPGQLRELTEIHLRFNRQATGLIALDEIQFTH